MKKILFFIFLILTTKCFAHTTYLPPGSKAWAFAKIANHPQIVWLLAPSENYSISKGWIPTNSWSHSITTMHSNEYEKTLSSLFCLDLIYSGSKDSYKMFIAPQKKDVLTYDSFIHLHHSLLKLLKNSSITLYDIESILITRDLAKSETFRKYVQEQCLIKENDSHFFVAKLVDNYPNLMKDQLLINGKTLTLMKNIDVIHIGHITHLEGGPFVFTKLKHSETLHKDHLMQLRFIVDMLEAAAANAHINNKGSIILTQKLYDEINAAHKFLPLLSKYDEKYVMDKYIQYKASKYGITITNDIDTVIIRLCSMIHADNTQTKVIMRTLRRLPQNHQDLIVSQLNPMLYIKEHTPTYMPNFLSAVLGTPKSQHINEDTIEKLVLFLAAVLQKHRKINQHLALQEQNVLAFNEATKQIQTEKHLNNTNVFTLNNGVVKLK